MVRLIVSRGLAMPGSQFSLFTTWDCHVFVTNGEGEFLDLRPTTARPPRVEGADPRARPVAHLADPSDPSRMYRGFAPASTACWTPSTSWIPRGGSAVGLIEEVPVDHLDQPVRPPLKTPTEVPDDQLEAVAVHESEERRRGVVLRQPVPKVSPLEQDAHQSLLGLLAPCGVLTQQIAHLRRAGRRIAHHFLEGSCPRGNARRVSDHDLDASGEVRLVTRGPDPVTIEPLSNREIKSPLRQLRENEFYR